MLELNEWTMKMENKLCKSRRCKIVQKRFECREGGEWMSAIKPCKPHIVSLKSRRHFSGDNPDTDAAAAGFECKVSNASLTGSLELSWSAPSTD